MKSQTLQREVSGELETEGSRNGAQRAWKVKTCDFPGITDEEASGRMKGDDEFGVGKNLQRCFHQTQSGQTSISFGQEGKKT